MTGRTDDDRRPLWQQLVVVVVPILVTELALAGRDWLRREHKARLRARRSPP